MARDSAGLGHGYGARRVECRMKQEQGREWEGRGKRGNSTARRPLKIVYFDLI